MMSIIGNYIRVRRIKEKIIELNKRNDPVLLCMYIFRNGECGRDYSRCPVIYFDENKDANKENCCDFYDSNSSEKKWGEIDLDKYSL